MIIMKMRLLMGVLGLMIMMGKISIMKMSHIQTKIMKMSLILILYCGAVPGTVYQATAVPLPATTTFCATSATSLTVFG
jgi:hypothetical protein